MALSAKSAGKGKDKVTDLTEAVVDSTSESDSPSSASDSSSDSDSEFSDLDSDDEVTPEYLESLLEKARQNYRAAAAKEAEARKHAEGGEEEIITLGGADSTE
ncbi:hypothetical protein DXG03_005968, partial [Asterophora parasitica]